MPLTTLINSSQCLTEGNASRALVAKYVTETQLVNILSDHCDRQWAGGGGAVHSWVLLNWSPAPQHVRLQSDEAYQGRRGGHGAPLELAASPLQDTLTP
jgi:hypothetical protein